MTKAKSKGKAKGKGGGKKVAHPSRGKRKPGGSAGKNGAKGPWGGLDPDTLQSLAQQLCRIRNRRSLFGGDDDHVLRHGPPGMCGRLVFQVLRFLRERPVAGLPSQRDLAHLVGVKPGGFGKFLEGKPSRHPPWITYAQQCVQHLALGTSRATDDDEVWEQKQHVVTRLREYFFRDYDQSEGTPPRVFTPARARFGEPTTRTELAGEIDYYTSERSITGRATKLIWVSGDSSFFPDAGGGTGTVGEAVHRADLAGVNVVFACPVKSAASRSLEDFIDHNGRSASETLRQIDLLSLGDNPPSRWWEFANPVVQYLYLSIQSTKDGKPAEALYILRGLETNEERERRVSPIALEGNDAERSAFKKWVARMGL